MESSWTCRSPSGPDGSCRGDLEGAPPHTSSFLARMRRSQPVSSVPATELRWNFAATSPLRVLLSSTRRRRCWIIHAMPSLHDVRALTFDVFGTCVDWRSGIAAEARRLGALAGVHADWESLADAWRALYMPCMDRVRRGELPWTNFDRLHRLSLDQVLRDAGAEGLDAAAREDLTSAWELLPPWPALISVRGTGRRHPSLLVSSLRREGIRPWDASRSV